MEVDPDDEILEVGFGNGANIDCSQLWHRRATSRESRSRRSALPEMASKKNAEAISDGRVSLHLVTPGAAIACRTSTRPFDKACTVATMYVIEDPAVVFTEMYRVLKSGGLAAVTFPYGRTSWASNRRNAEGFHFHELADLQAAFCNEGFTDTRTERNDQVRFGAHCILGHKAVTST